MALEVFRAGEGPPVVLVHGGSDPLETWSEQLVLQERWRLIVPYARGFGSSPPSRRRDFEQDADDLLALLDEPVHLAGCSYGGVAALIVAGRAPDRVRSLTVVEAPLFGIALDAPEVVRLRDTLVDPFAPGPDQRERLRDALCAFMDGGETADGDQFADRLDRVVRLLRGARPPGEAQPRLDAIAGVPALVVSGGHHPALETVADRLAGALGADRAVRAGARHFPQRLPEFNERFERFLLAAEARRERRTARPLEDLRR